MSAAISRTMRFGEWIGERTNPLLVKEVRQSLKSRQFIGSFALVLIACWLISVGGMLLTSSQWESQVTLTGREYFYAYFGVLSFAIFVVVPFQAFRSLINERDQYTFELLSITTMKPGQIVRGKLCSAMVQTCLFYSAIAPFVAMTNLLKGVSIPIIVFLLLISMAISSGLSAIAIAVGAACKIRSYQTGLTLLTLGLLLFFWTTSLAPLLFLLRETSIPFDDLEFWAWAVIFASYYVTYFLLTLQLCVSSLTFESDNRSTKIRLCLMALFWLTFGWSIGGLVLVPSHVSHDFGKFLATFLCVHVIAACVLVCFEPDHLSRRIRRQIRQRRYRLLLIPLLPGCTRGLLFCYAHLALSLFVVFLFVLPIDLNYAAGIFLYSLIYVSVATLINRLFLTFVSQYRPLLGQVVTLLVCMIAALVPYLVTAFDRVEPSPLFCTWHPFATLPYLAAGGPESPMIILILDVTAFLMVALNFPSIRRVIVDTMRLGVEPVEEKSL